MIVARDQETGTFSNEEIVGNALTMLCLRYDSDAGRAMAP